MGRFVIKATRTGVTFNLQADNYQTIASSEVYSSENACRKGIEAVVNAATAATVEDQTKENFTPRKHPKFEIYRDHTGQFRFRLKARNGEIVVVSEGYKAKASCLNGVKSVVRNAADAKVISQLDQPV